MRMWAVDPAVVAELGGAVQHTDPPRAVDNEALAQLQAMLLAAAEELSAVKGEVVVVGSAPAKFNDAGWDPWALARVDHEVVEDDGYGRRKDFDALVAAASKAVQRAADIWARLEEAGWRECWVRAFALPFNDEFLALVIERGLPWLVYASSNAGDRDHVFALWEPGGLRYVGECVEGTDDRLADPSEADPHTIRLWQEGEDRW